MRISCIEISVDHLLVHGGKASFEKAVGDSLAIGHEYKIGTGPRTNPSAFNFTTIYHTPEVGISMCKVSKHG